MAFDPDKFLGRVPAATVDTVTTVVPEEEKKSFLDMLLGGIGGAAKGLYETGKSAAQTPQHAMEALGTIAGRPATTGDVVKGTGKKIAQAAASMVLPAAQGASIYMSPEGIPNLEQAAQARKGAEVINERLQPANEAQEVGGKFGSSLADLATFFAPGPKLGKVTEPGLKGVANKIESTVIGKGNKALLKKENLKLSDVANTALENKVASTPAKTVEKINDVLADTETKIDAAIEKAKAANPNAKINVDDIVYKVFDRIDKGEPSLFGQSDDAMNALAQWEKEIKKYGYSGEQGLNEAQAVKRLLGKKGFKKGAAPTPEINAKEQVADLLNLELKDQLEKNIPEIKELNQKYKQLIPIKKMAENREPVGRSNDLIGLGSMISGGLGGVAGAVHGGGMTPEAILMALGSAGVYNASKSGDVAQLLYNIANATSKSSLSPTVTGAAINATRGK